MLLQLISQNNFIAFSFHESLKSYKVIKWNIYLKCGLKVRESSNSVYMYITFWCLGQVHVFRVTLEVHWCWRLMAIGYRLALYPLVTSVVSQDILGSIPVSQSMLTGYMTTWSSSREHASDWTDTQLQCAKRVSPCNIYSLQSVSLQYQLFLYY
jgi:hypothetical protein